MTCDRERDTTERPSVEFSRSTYRVVLVAAGLGLVLAVGVVWYVLTGGGR